MHIPQAIMSTQEISGPSLVVGVGQVQQPLALPQIFIPSFSSRTIAETGKMGRDKLTFGVSMLAGPPVVRAGGIWLYQETVQQLNQAPWSRSPLEIARAAVAGGLNQKAGLAQGMLTQHALMVAWGEFAHQIGLIDQLKQVAVPQKEMVHAPQAKLLTFLMGILTGIEHLKDFNEGAQDRKSVV